MKHLTPTEVHWPDEGFSLRNNMSTRTPIVIRGFDKALPALASWDISRFAKAYGKESVPVSTLERNPSTFPAWVGDSQMPFDQFTATVQKSSQPIYAEAMKLSSELSKELGKPDFLADSSWDPLLWIGSPATATPLHIDWWHNLLMIVDGHKEVGLLPPRASVKAVPWYKTHRFHSNTFAISEVSFNDMVTVDLGPGDSLYIPPGWWHRVRNPDMAISLTNFWYDKRYLLRHKFLKALGVILRI